MRGDRFSAPTEWGELWPLLGRPDDDVRVVGGGTWVVPELQRGREPVHLVSLRRLPVKGIKTDGRVLRLGATTTYADVLSSSTVRETAPMLSQLAAGVTGGPQIRTQGTLGGAAVAARPPSDLPAALCALDASLVLASVRGCRRVPAPEFFLDAGRADVRTGEVLAEMHVPVAGPADPLPGHGYVKIKGAASSWPIVTAAAVLRVEGGRVAGTVAVGGLGRRPLTVDAPALLGGDGVTSDELLRPGRWRLPAPDEVWEDELAPADYRSAVAPVAVHRALAQACSTLAQTGVLP